MSQCQTIFGNGKREGWSSAPRGRHGDSPNGLSERHDRPLTGNLTGVPATWLAHRTEYRRKGDSFRPRHIELAFST